MFPRDAFALPPNSFALHGNTFAFDSLLQGNAKVYKCEVT